MSAHRTKATYNDSGSHSAEEGEANVTDRIDVPERIIDQIRKLQALSGSSNEHEAALAASKAEELLQKYRLTIADLAVNDPALDEAVELGEVVDIPSGRGINFRWKVELLFALARYNFCKALISNYGTHRRMMIIGRKTDTEVVRFLFDILTRQLEAWSLAYPVSPPKHVFTKTGELVVHLGAIHGIFHDPDTGDTLMDLMVDSAVEAKHAAQKLHRDEHNKPENKEWGPRKSFLFGAVETISHRLYEQWQSFSHQQDAEANSKALVLVDTTDKKLTKFIEDRWGKLKGHYNSGDWATGRDHAAYRAGQEAGRRAQMQKGIGAKGVGTRAIGSGR